MALAQATASPLTAIAAGARLDPDIASSPLVAMDLIRGLERMVRGVSILRARSASACNALTGHLLTAANNSWIHERFCSDADVRLASIRAVGHRLSARHGSRTRS